MLDITQAHVSQAATWDRFCDYVLAPYETARHAKLIAWCDRLAETIGRRHGRNAVKLSFLRGRHEMTGRTFQAYGLNDKIYFSHNPAVLTLPHVAIENTHAQEKWVGVWLHSFPDPDAAFNAKYFPALEQVRHIQSESPDIPVSQEVPFSEFENSACLGSIYSTIGLKMIAQSLFGEMSQRHVNRIQSDNTLISISSGGPPRKKWHHDEYLWDDPDMEEFRRSFGGLEGFRKIMPDGGWLRLFSYALKSYGTAYKAGVIPDLVIPCTPFAVSSHIMSASQPDQLGRWIGAAHKSAGDPDGRAVMLIMSNVAPVMKKKSPWQITTQDNCTLG